MSHIIIDRRKNAKEKSVVNRRKFVKRVRSQVREAMKDVIRDGSIKDIVDTKGKKIRIPGKGLKKPTFHHGEGGIHDDVHSGNKQFQQGDRISRPPEGGGKGGKEGSPDGEGDDGFIFELTKDEFLEIFFEDLELPDLVKKTMAKTDEYVNRRAGFSVDGNPSRLNIERSLRQAKGRKIGLGGKKKRKVRELKKELAQLEDSIVIYQEKADGWETLNDQDIKNRIDEVKLEILVLSRKIEAIPFIDDVDIRYNRWERVPQPKTQAVMFGIMDVSASMGEWEKEMAKRFFMLMLLFLTKNYERVDIVWIRHHTLATEVNEDEFFHSRETGGTIVSSALHLMKEIVAARYPREHWNVFANQISDGDNWGSDNIETMDLMRNSILPACQYFCYVEVDENGGEQRHSSDLWPHYEQLKHEYQNMEMSIISDVTEIYPTFRGLFEKRD